MNDDELLDLAEQAGFEVEQGDVCIGGTPCTEEVRALIELLQPKSEVQPATTRAVDRFIVLYAEVEDLLGNLREQHETNYGIEASKVDWGDVGSLSHFVEVLQYAVHALPNRQT